MSIKTHVLPNLGRVLMPAGLEADRGHSYASLETEATRFRQILKLDATSAISGPALWDTVPARLVVHVGSTDHQVEVEIASLENHRDGQAYWDPDFQKYIVALSEDAYRRLELGQTWVLVHELMHVWLHARLMQRLKRSEIYLTKAYRERELKFPHRQAWDCEWQANAGAAAVILPAPGIRIVEEHSRPDQLLFRLIESFKASRLIVERRLAIYRAHEAALLSAGDSIRLSSRTGESVHSSPWADWDSLRAKEKVRFK